MTYILSPLERAALNNALIKSVNVVMPTIEVKYSCPLCGTKDRDVTVIARDPNVDVVQWMNTVCIIALGDDHHKHSPRCLPQRLHDIKVPIGAYNLVGTAAVN